MITPIDIKSGSMFFNKVWVIFVVDEHHILKYNTRISTQIIADFNIAYNIMHNFNDCGYPNKNLGFLR